MCIRDSVISAEDASDIYEVPLMFKEEKLDEYIIKKLRLERRTQNNEWEQMVKKLRSLEKEVTIAVVGKYINVKDSYLSIREALKHGGIAAGCRVNVLWIDSEELEKVDEVEIDADGILVPGGFGQRGAEGKMRQYSMLGRTTYRS